MRAVLWLGLRALQALCAAVPNEKKTIVSRVQREYVTCCSGTHRDWRAIWSTVTRSTKALLSAATPDAWWAKWASVLTSATENRLETCACRTTQTQMRFLANRTLYMDQMHKLSHVQSHWTITSVYRDRTDVGVQSNQAERPGPQSRLNEVNVWNQSPLKERRSQLWQLPAISWDVLILNQNLLVTNRILYPSLSDSREEAVRAKTDEPCENSLLSRCRSDLICTACSGTEVQR